MHLEADLRSAALNSVLASVERSSPSPAAQGSCIELDIVTRISQLDMEPVPQITTEAQHGTPDEAHVMHLSGGPAQNTQLDNQDPIATGLGADAEPASHDILPEETCSFLAQITTSVTDRTTSTSSPMPTRRRRKQLTITPRRSRRLAVVGIAQGFVQRAQHVLMKKLGLATDQHVISQNEVDAYA